MLYKLEKQLHWILGSAIRSPSDVSFMVALMRLWYAYSTLLLGALSTSVWALGTSCTAPLGAGTAAASDPFWMQNIKHQGISAFNSNPSGYQVFRNVKVGILFVEGLPKRNKY